VCCDKAIIIHERMISGATENIRRQMRQIESLSFIFQSQIRTAKQVKATQPPLSSSFGCPSYSHSFLIERIRRITASKHFGTYFPSDFILFLVATKLFLFGLYNTVESIPSKPPCPQQSCHQLQRISPYLPLYWNFPGPRPPTTPGPPRHYNDPSFLSGLSNTPAQPFASQQRQSTRDHRRRR